MAPRDPRAIRKSWSQRSPGAEEQKPDPLLLGPPFPAFFLYSRIPAGTAQESQAKRFSPLLIPHLPKQERYHHFTNEINLRFQKQTTVQPQLLYMGYCLPLPPSSLINLEASLKYFQTFNQVHFSKCHHSEGKEGKKVTQMPIMLLHLQSRKGNQLVGFIPVTLLLGASRISISKKAHDTTTYQIRLEFQS